MRSVTAAYRRIIASGESRNFLITVNMTLADNTRLTLTEEDIWADSFGIDTASSGKNTFDIGSAVIGMCKFQINNFDEKFNRYDFFSATAVVWVKLIGDDTYYRLGFYTVDEPKYVGPLISLELLNNMWKFDVPLSEAGVVFPATMGQAVARVCAYCGVSLATQTFHGYNFVLDKAPDQNMNCRELLQYIAMIGCNFCDIDDAGSLRLKWYDTASRPSDNLDGGTFYTNTTPYSDGDVADGGNFINYQHGANYDGGSFTDNPNVAYFTRNFNTEIGTDEITVTGVKITINDTEYMIGERGYVLDLKENPLVNEDNVNTVLNLIWDVLKDFRMRTFNATTLPDLSVEIGDCCVVKDLHGNYIVSYVTNNSFRFADYQVSLGAISPARTLVKRYSKSVQTAVEVARQKVNEQLSTYDLAVQTMNSLAINAMGAYYDYEDLATGGRVYYLSNMPIEKDEDGHCSFTTNSSVFKTTGDGLFVSVDGGRTWTNGYNTHTGELIVNVLYTIGLHADWINTGTLTVGGNGTKPTIQVLDSSNNVVCTINSDGIIMGKGYIASSDYADTTPVSPYSQSGMKIDVNNKYVKSPFFGFDENGAHLKGEIEASSGHIGAASITSNAILIDGEILLWRGSGRFVFRPIDYGITGQAQVTFKVVDTYTGSTTLTLERKFDDGTVLPDSTYTLTDNTPMNIWLRSADPEDEDNYITFTFVCSERTIEAVLNSEIAYMGVGGFRGVFDGVLNSPQGKIAGTNYNSSGFTEGLYFNGIVNGHPAYVYVSPTTVLRRYYDPDVGDYVSESAFDQIDDYQPFIAQEIITPVHTANEGTLVFEGINGDTRKKLWRREGNQWIEIELGASISYGTDEPTGGNDGDAYIQLSSDLKISYVSADQAWTHERFIYDDSKITGMVISGHGTGGNDIIAYKLTGLVPDVEVTINFTAQITSGSPVYYNRYPNGAYADNAVSTSSRNYIAFTQGTAAHNYSLSFTPSDSVAYFWIQLADINDSYTITLDITNLTFQGAVGGSGIKALWVNENGTWQSGYFGGSGGDVFVGATASTAGAKGLVPAPSAGDQNKYLRGDGTWHTVSGGGGGSRTKTLLWGNSTITHPATANADPTLSDDWANYDALLIVTGWTSSVQCVESFIIETDTLSDLPYQTSNASGKVYVHNQNSSASEWVRVCQGSASNKLHFFLNGAVGIYQIWGINY